MHLEIPLNSFWCLRGINMSPSSFFFFCFFLFFDNAAHVLRFRFGLKTDAPSIERRRENVSQCIAIRTMKARMSTLHPPIRSYQLKTCHLVFSSTRQYRATATVAVPGKP